MKKLFKSILFANRARRSRAVAATRWILRLVWDFENDEMNRCSDSLGSIAFKSGIAARPEYAAIEDECSLCECSLGFLQCAIDDLGFAYDRRF